MKLSAVAIAAGATMLSVTAALADPEGGYADGAWAGHHMWGWGGGFGMIFGPFFMLLWLGLIVFPVVVAFRWLSGGTLGKSEDSALDTLRARYAKGEIDTEEFQERLKSLQG